MIEFGVQTLVYGHDHLFSHSSLEEIHYLCCGRLTQVNRRPSLASMRASYGDLMAGRMGEARIRSPYHVPGYTCLTVTSHDATVA